MKITAVKPIIVAEARNFFFVVVETDEGISGVGEGGITWREKATAGFVEDGGEPAHPRYFPPLSTIDKELLARAVDPARYIKQINETIH